MKNKDIEINAPAEDVLKTLEEMNIIEEFDKEFGFLFSIRPFDREKEAIIKFILKALAEQKKELDKVWSNEIELK